MRTKTILGLTIVVIAGLAFFAGLLVERGFLLLSPSVPNPPVLLGPAQWKVLPNGDLEKATQTYWDFSWSEVRGAERYQLRINHPTGPWIDVVTEQLQYSLAIPGRWSFTGGAEKVWSWQVRAQTRGGWSRWSEAREFHVAESTK